MVYLWDQNVSCDHCKKQLLLKNLASHNKTYHNGAPMKYTSTTSKSLKEMFNNANGKRKLCDPESSSSSAAEVDSIKKPKNDSTEETMRQESHPVVKICQIPNLRNYGSTNFVYFVPEIYIDNGETSLVGGQ